MSWLFQSPPGLALVLKREMVFRGALERKQDLYIKRQRNHDLVFAGKLKNADGLPLLRVADVVYRCPIFGRYKISKRQLETLANDLRPLGPRRLVVQVAGRVFDRRDLSRWLEKELEARDYQFSDDVESEVWMFCIDEAYYFGVPLNKARVVAGRDERESERHGSLPPTIAAAMAFSGQPRNDDVIYDPVCGSGTLLAEAGAYAPEAIRIGSDIDPEAIQIARINLKANIATPENATTPAVELSCRDSRKALARNDISLVLANLPFGRQFGEKKDNPELYHELLQALMGSAAQANARKGAHPWRAVLLTSDLESLRAALSRMPDLESTDLFRVKIRGELATAIMTKRKGSKL